MPSKPKWGVSPSPKSTQSKLPQPTRSIQPWLYLVVDQKATLVSYLSRSSRWLRSSREPGSLLCQTLTATFTLFLQPGSKELLVFGSLCFGLGNSLLLLSNSGALPLQSQRSHQPLNFRSLANLFTCQQGRQKTGLFPLSCQSLDIFGWNHKNVTTFAYI